MEDMRYVMCGSFLVRLRISSPNRVLQREREYDTKALCQLGRTNVPLLNSLQKEVYDMVMKANDDGTLACCGTGTTLIISLILATVLASSEIAIAVASSGIATTLLKGCRTAHLALKLLLNLQAVKEPICKIAKHSAMAKVLVANKIIICN